MTAPLLVAKAPWALAGNHRNDLYAILRAEVALAIWRRDLSEILAHSLESLCATGFEDILLGGDADSVQRRLSRRAGAWRFVDAYGKRAILEDVIGLARLFRDLIGEADIELRLEWVTDNGCSKFHRDRTVVRLLTTYAGRGTEFIPPPNEAEALVQQARYRGPIAAIPTGAVALLKGESASHCGVLHRSPPIEGTGSGRILLCISPRDRMSETASAGSFARRSANERAQPEFFRR